MHTKYAVIPTLCLLASTPVLAAGHTEVHASVPPASFLNYHVSTVHELSQEVTIDPAVRARLANHFHISEAQMTQYVRRNLVLTHLQKTGRYKVACVGQNGREYWIESRLPAGTAIFASRATGHPILKLACGNPMVSSLPPSIKTAESRESMTPPQFAFLPPPTPAGSVPMPGLLTAADVTPTDLVVASTDVTPAVVEVSPSLETLIPGALLSGGSSAFNALPAVLGAVALGVASTGHGGSSPSVTPPAIPEASTSISLGTMLLLGSGAWLAARRKRTSEKTS